jgi:hypothetical protein
MWWRMPYNQLAKCAEANGLRKAFPRVLGGVYIAEEMEQERTIEGTAVESKPTLAELAASKAAAIKALEERMPEGEPKVRWVSAPGSPAEGVDPVNPPPESKVIEIMAEPMSAEASAKYANAEEVAEGARPVLRLPASDEAPPWTRQRLHDAAVKAHIPSTLIGSTFAEVAEGRKPAELTEADWREIALRLGLGA